MTAKPTRIQLHRTKGWHMPPNTVSVARPSKWGNPFWLGLHLQFYLVGQPPEPLVVDAASAVTLYELYLRHLEAGRKLLRDHAAELVGKNLACYCALDQPCHVDVLIELVAAARDAGHQ